MKEGEIEQDVPLSRTYSNEFFPQLTDFDRDAIRRQAAAFDIGAMK